MIPLEECIFFQLAKVYQKANRIVAEKLAQYNLTPVQSLVIDALLIKDNISSRELGEILIMDSASITGIVDRLEKGGFLRRETHPNDRRANSLVLTDKARALEKELDMIVKESTSELFKNFSKEEEMTLRRLLLRLRENE